MSPAAGAVLMVLTGAQLSQQAPVNRGLARSAGAIVAAFVNFLVGALALFLACLLAGQTFDFGDDFVWWHAMGGVMAATFVLTALWAVHSIGASGIAAGTVCGQLLSSVVIDSFGALGVGQRPLDAAVALGAVVVIAGTVLVTYDGAPAAVARERPWLPLLAIGFAGALIGVQIPLNGLLAQSTGSLQSGLINFVVGGSVLAAAVVATRSSPGLKAVGRVHWYYLTGGLFGATGALVSLVLVDQIGAGTVAASTVTGQTLASLLIDRLGLLGLHRRPISPLRLGGTALVIAGTVLIAG